MLRKAFIYFTRGNIKCRNLHTTIQAKLNSFHLLSSTNCYVVNVRSVGLQGTRNMDNLPVLTMEEVKHKIMQRLGLEESYVPIPKSRDHLLQYEPKPGDLPTRRMIDSVTAAVIPLSTAIALRDRYVTFLGGLRLGRIMEDLDLFAVWVCHQHLHLPKLPADIALPYTFVTILVDKIVFSDVRTKSSQDVRLTGHVTWVGKSSMEIAVWVEQMQENKWHEITTAVFLMAARNAINTAPAPVNTLELTSGEEVKIFNGGEERRKMRKILQESSIFKMEPNDREQTLMYELYKRTTPQTTMELNRRILPENCRWMSDSYVRNTITSFPENRNAHNTVFGGFLMRNSYEISWACACMYSKSRPKLEHTSDISFHKPVNVSSFLKMTAYVIYTEKNYMQIMTVADIMDTYEGGQLTSNVFYYTFSAPENLLEVLPRSYQETMWYIHGRRKIQTAFGLQ